MTAKRKREQALTLLCHIMLEVPRGIAIFKKETMPRLPDGCRVEQQAVQGHRLVSQPRTLRIAVVGLTSKHCPHARQSRGSRAQGLWAEEIHIGVEGPHQIQIENPLGLQAGEVVDALRQAWPVVALLVVQDRIDQARLTQRCEQRPRSIGRGTIDDDHSLDRSRGKDSPEAEEQAGEQVPGIVVDRDHSHRRWLIPAGAGEQRPWAHRLVSCHESLPPFLSAHAQCIRLAGERVISGPMEGYRCVTVAGIYLETARTRRSQPLLISVPYRWLA